RGMGTLASYAAGKASNRQDDLAGNFADAFGKATGQQMSYQSNNLVTGTSKMTVGHTDRKGLDSNKLSEAGEKSAIQDKKLDETIQKEVEKMGEKLVNAVAKELNVSEEEVVSAMEKLGMTMGDLMNPNKLTQLVLALSGTDVLGLMTDGGLYQSLQNLLGMALEAQKNLAAELGITPEELAAFMEQLKSQNGEMTNLQTQLLAEENVQAEGQEDYSVTVEEDGEMVKVSVKVDGNAKTETTEVTSTKVMQEGTMSEEKEGNSKGDALMQGSDTQANLLLESIVNKDALGKADAVFENAMMSRSVNTQDIMNQIMEYMKVHIKADMTQMEIQLHPASLGTININITAKDGVITAQFLTQNEMVKAAVESQLVQLKNSFEEQGIKIDAVEVAVGTHQFERNLNGEGNGQQEFQEEKKKGVRRINLNELDPEDTAELNEEEQIAVAMMSVEGNTVNFTA
ncbi:MAG: flagellar hook-length control protein FliK, partial [Lachnospiraceae bacterium]|nr:flagellar hook-length control protein FliK [Lachnospiraceae bacterium]